MIKMDSKAQVSFEYLLTVTFAILLTLAVAALIVVVNNIATESQTQLLDYRNKTISSLMGA